VSIVSVVGGTRMLFIVKVDEELKLDVENTFVIVTLLLFPEHDIPVLIVEIQVIVV
jgi:hypothetical protein